MNNQLQCCKSDDKNNPLCRFLRGKGGALRTSLEGLLVDQVTPINDQDQKRYCLLHMPMQGSKMTWDKAMWRLFDERLAEFSTEAGDLVDISGIHFKRFNFSEAIPRASDKGVKHLHANNCVFSEGFLLDRPVSKLELNESVISGSFVIVSNIENELSLDGAKFRGKFSIKCALIGKMSLREASLDCSNDGISFGMNDSVGDNLDLSGSHFNFAEEPCEMVIGNGPFSILANKIHVRGGLKLIAEQLKANFKMETGDLGGHITFMLGGSSCDFDQIKSVDTFTLSGDIRRISFRRSRLLSSETPEGSGLTLRNIKCSSLSFSGDHKSDKFHTDIDGLSIQNVDVRESLTFGTARIRHHLNSSYSSVNAVEFNKMSLEGANFAGFKEIGSVFFNDVVSNGTVRFRSSASETKKNLTIGATSINGGKFSQLVLDYCEFVEGLEIEGAEFVSPPTIHKAELYNSSVFPRELGNYYDSSASAEAKYRALRLAMYELKDRQTERTFIILEQRCARKQMRAGVQKTISWLYWKISEYGTNPTRALVFLSIVIFAPALAIALPEWKAIIGESSGLQSFLMVIDSLLYNVRDSLQHAFVPFYALRTPDNLYSALPRFVQSIFAIAAISQFVISLRWLYRRD